MNADDAGHKPNSDPGGVVFSAKHQVGFWRRALASFIDFAVIYVLYMVLFTFWWSRSDSPWFNAFTFLLATTLVVALYIGPLKRSWLRTPGYRVAGVRIVNLRGERPALTMMLLRGAMYLFGTGFALIDFAWILGQRPRQKLSDLVAGTYVVRVDAKPMAHGEIVLAYYLLGGHFWVFREVRAISRAPALADQGVSGPSILNPGVRS